MNKEQIVKELTIAAINNKMITTGCEKNDSYTHISEQIAENVAAFYNKLLSNINVQD